MQGGTVRIPGGSPAVRWLPIMLLLLALTMVMILATALGSIPIAPAEIFGAIGRGLTGELMGSHDIIIWQIRLPRVVMAALVGAALALAGATYQAVFRNPLADPYLLGVASGASFGATLVIAFGASLPLLARIGVPLTAFVAALTSVTLVVALARQGNQLPTLSLILAGVVLGSCLTAATSFIMFSVRERAAEVLTWLLGSFALSSWRKVAVMTPFLLLATVATLLAGRSLNVLQVGDEQAAQLGLPVQAVKLGLIVCATLVTAAAVSVAGIIGFVGLVVPHAVRLAFGPDHRTLLPLSLLGGGIFTVAADLLARTVISPTEIPIGVVTALAGSPFFLFLLRWGRGVS